MSMTASCELNYSLLFQHMEDNSMVLFQLVGHNPASTDPTKEQWHEMSSILKKKNMLVFFDMAYQGFASGNLEEDSYGLRHFIEQGHRVVFAQSYSEYRCLNLNYYFRKILLTQFDNSRQKYGYL